MEGALHQVMVTTDHNNLELFATTKEIWRLRGLPKDIVSDQDSRFTSNVWQVFLANLGIKSQMSVVFHPQTDG